MPTVPVDIAPAWRSGLSVKKICNHATTHITYCRHGHCQLQVFHDLYTWTNGHLSCDAI